MLATIQNARLIAGIAAMISLAACSGDTTGSNTHAVQLSFTTNASVSAAENRVAADFLVGPSNELVLHKVQLVFGKFELDRTGAADCVGEAEAGDKDGGGDHHGMGDECAEVSRNPVLVDVPLDNALHPVINVPLPAGTFSELEAKLEPAADRFTDFNAANPDLIGKSVRVEGTFNGAPVRIQLAGSVEAGDGVRSARSSSMRPPGTRRSAFDVRKWFLNADGR